MMRSLCQLLPSPTAPARLFIPEPTGAPNSAINFRYLTAMAGLVVAFQTFGSAMHTVMDNWSPMHRDFQLCDGTNMTMAFGPGPRVQFGLDMLDHANGETRIGRPPRSEMKHC